MYTRINQTRGRARRLRSSGYERSRKKESDWTEKVILQCSLGHNSLFVLNYCIEYAQSTDVITTGDTLCANLAYFATQNPFLGPIYSTMR